MNKVIKIQIIPSSMDFKKFNSLMFNLQKETRAIMNKTIQMCWEYDGYASEYKKQYGVFPSEKEILKGKKQQTLSLSGYINNRLNEGYMLYSANSSQSQQRAIKKWKSDSKEIFTGERSITNYKRDIPLDLHNKSLGIFKNSGDGKYYCNIKLLNRTGSKECELESSEITVMLLIVDNSSKTIIQRIMNGEYKIGGSQIVKHKTKCKWFLNLTYSFEQQIKETNKNNILGVDMGIVYPVYMAINNSLKRDKIEGGEIEKFRKGIESRRLSMLKQGKHCGDGRVGHGTKTRINPIELLTDKVSNFRTSCNHKYSRFVVDFAVKNECGVIQMEDLSAINKENVFLKKWSYYDLQQKIKYKAEEIGVEIKLIKPNYTSQRCSKCGFIHKENRPDQKTFKCLDCGFESNADYNAAKNIATDGIEKIIEEQINKQNKNINNMKYVV